MSPPPHILILVEGKSEERFLRSFLPLLGLNGEADFFLKPYGGKPKFRSMSRKILRQWKMPGARRLVVLQDQDMSDCDTVKKDIRGWVQGCSKQFEQLSIRIACRELESWYLGDPDALWSAYPDASGEARRRVEKHRDNPDATPQQPSDILFGVAGKNADFPKVNAAAVMGGILGRKCAEGPGDGFGGNRSRSFQHFVMTMRDALKELREAQGGGSS